jgi:hypothetical protein
MSLTREQEIFERASAVFNSPRIWNALTDNPEITREDLSHLEKLMEVCLPDQVRDQESSGKGIWVNGMYVPNPDDLDQHLERYSDGSRPVYEVVSHNSDIVGY